MVFRPIDKTAGCITAITRHMRSVLQPYTFIKPKISFVTPTLCSRTNKVPSVDIDITPFPLQSYAYIVILDTELFLKLCLYVLVNVNLFFISTETRRKSTSYGSITNWKQQTAMKLHILNFWSLVVTICTAMFNIHKLYVMPTQCIYVFCVDLRTNSDYFTVQH
jgi:hypothetical protein